jgi:hypothetical protein
LQLEIHFATAARWHGEGVGTKAEPATPWPIAIDTSRGDGAYTKGMKKHIKVPGLEDRLEKRYNHLVAEHSGHAHPGAAGPRHLPRSDAKAATQAAWRFFKNPRTKTTLLAQPLLQEARRAAASDCAEFALIMGDWSHLNYSTHSDQPDRIQIGNKGEIGYELFSQLLVSDQDGQPLAPVCVRLEAAAGMYSSVHNAPGPVPSQLDALTADCAYVSRLGLGKRPVFIADAEVDSVYHYRRWCPEHLFLIRVDDERKVLFEEQEKALPEVVELVRQRQAFAAVGQVDYKGENVRQYVAEAEVTLQREACLNRVVKGRRQRITVPGEPLTLRLIVSELRREDGTVVARWLLLSNVPAAVAAATLALWYYWRWQLESYFKLLKGAGQQLEQWQQETGERVLKRLLVASMACVLVWRLARDQTEQGARARGLLVALSGRQMAYGKEFTEEALLAGLWVLLAMLDTLEHYQPDDLHRLAATIWSG